MLGRHMLALGRTWQAEGRYKHVGRGAEHLRLELCCCICSIRTREVEVPELGQNAAAAKSQGQLANMRRVQDSGHTSRAIMRNLPQLLVSVGIHVDKCIQKSHHLGLDLSVAHAFVSFWLLCRFCGTSTGAKPIP